MEIVVCLSTSDSVTLPVPEGLISPLRTTLMDAAARSGPEVCGQRATVALIQSLLPEASPDARPPTAAQLKYAIDISRRLGIELPAGVLTERGAVGAFISLYAGRL